MQQFTNETIDIAALPAYEEVKLESIAASYWRIIIFNILLFFAFVFTGVGILSFNEGQLKEFCWIFFGVVTLLLLLTIWGYRVSFKRRGFALREKDIIYKSGIVAETTTIVPLKNIQHIELNEGWMSRILKLATIEIFTAGGGTGHMQISGIPIAQAKSLKEALLKHVDLVSGNDATI